jgi:hypothetical protein
VEKAGPDARQQRDQVARARWLEEFQPRSLGLLVCAAAGSAARSGARTGPARRPAAAAEGRT